jgi:nitroreductase
MFPNETIRLLNERASLRNFADHEIEHEKIDILMQTACNSASGGNLQPVSIIKIQDQAMRTKLGEMCWQPFIGKAPLNLLFCLDLHRNEVIAQIGEAPFMCVILSDISGYPSRMSLSLLKVYVLLQMLLVWVHATLVRLLNIWINVLNCSLSLNMSFLLS